MLNRLNFKVPSILFLLAATAFSVYAQTRNLPNPRQEKLLNGLKVLMWNDPQAEKVSVKIRVHSGSAFDPQGKEGVMQMLADNIFPSESAREFFADDLGGSLEVATNYDYIQINATAKSEEFLTMLETLANAVSKPTIDKETTAKLRSARLEKINELEKNPAYVADRAVAQRLLGTFPYGRPQMGTPQSVQKIDFADLIFAKDRFFTADNATIAISGNIKPELAFRAVRRYFGAWAKSENRVPATFRQPDEPDTKAAVIKSPLADNSEIRFALRGFARNDKDFTASKILTKIMQNRLRKEFSKEQQINAFVRQDSNLLPGVIVVGLSNLPMENGASTAKTENIAANLVSGKITVDEFEKAKTEVLTEVNQQPPAEIWLDVDTYRLASAKDDFQKISGVTINEVQAVAEKLIKTPTVTVMLVGAKDEKKM
ncbi:MAG TPA: pitrilysin family protein [Pyrinomonadaceae bacterium]|jgi:zinc protease